MADQGKWFKLWESALDDQELENLDLDNWARWARLGTYFKKHGTEGVLVIQPPCRALQTLLRLSNFEAVIRVIKVLPGYVIEEVTPLPSHVTIASVTIKITFRNWSKYQGDFSARRMRRWRAKKTSHVTVQEERRRDVEEKRREDPQTPVPSASPTSPAAEPATARTNGLQPAGKIVSTLRINGKPYVPEPEIPEAERMAAEEMRDIRLANMNQAKATSAETPGGDDDVL